MTVKDVGLTLIGIGVVFVAGIPPGGFSAFGQLLEEYREAKRVGKLPGLDAQDANVMYWRYWIGVPTIVLGAVIWLLSTIFGGEV